MLKFELHLNVEQPITAIELLTKHCDLSISQIKQAVFKGTLWLTKHEHLRDNNTTKNDNDNQHTKYTQRLRRIKKTLQQGDCLHFYYDETVLTQQPKPAQLIADLQAYSIWFKPYGVFCQGSKWSEHCTINRWVETHIQPQRPAFIVHRLDRAASGLIIIAHSKKAAKAFSLLFEQHQLTKTYQIICHGDHSTHSQPEKITIPIDDKSANSEFNLLEYNSEHNLSLIQVNIGSGRKHQIRKHAAAINLPVVGDRLHGDNNQRYPDNLNLQLCAVSLSFNCPFTKRLQKFELPTKLKPSLINAINLLDND